MRDFSQVYPDDKFVRTKENYLSTEKLTVSNVQADLVLFSVTLPFYLANNRVLNPCHCKWRSAHCVYEFHYDLFFIEGIHYLYLEVSLYMQLCRRHKRMATDI